MNKQQLLKSLEEKGFSKSILNAFSKVKRENFIPKNLEERAYEDAPLPIGERQTISQPYTIAVMLNMLNLQKSQKVLEIGSGCGYVLALIAEIVGEKGEIYGIEIISELAEKSRQNLRQYKNIKIYNKNGRKRLNKKSFLDRIIISAACDKIPKQVLYQLDEKGIIVAPVGPRYNQALISIERIKDDFKIKEKLSGFIFVPFV